jgi:hypothetical protein
MSASSTDTDLLDYIEMPSDDAPTEPASNEQQDHYPVPKVATERTKSGEGADSFV